MTDATYACSFTQTDPLRIRQCSSLTVDRMITPGGGHTGRIPSLSFARGMAKSVQYRGNLIIAVANGHATNDLQRLNRRRGFGRGTGPLHRKLRVRSSLPVDYQLKGLFILIS